MLGLRLQTSQPYLGSTAEIAYFSRNHVRFSAIKELVADQEVSFTHQPTQQLTINLAVKFSLKTVRKTIKFVRFGQNEECIFEDGQQRFVVVIRHREVYSQPRLHVSYVRCDSLLNTQAIVLRDEEKQFSVSLHQLERPIIPLLGDELTILITELKTGEHTLQMRIEKLEPGIHALAAGPLLLLLVLQREAYKRPYDVAFALKINEFALKSVPARIECSKLKNNKYYCKLPGPNDNELFLGHQCVDKHTELFICESVQQACDQSRRPTTIAGKGADSRTSYQTVGQPDSQQSEKTAQLAAVKQPSDDLPKQNEQEVCSAAKLELEYLADAELGPRLTFYPEKLLCERLDRVALQQNASPAAQRNDQIGNDDQQCFMAKAVNDKPTILIQSVQAPTSEQEELPKPLQNKENERQRSSYADRKQYSEEQTTEKCQQHHFQEAKPQQLEDQPQSCQALHHQHTNSKSDEYVSVQRKPKDLGDKVSDAAAKTGKLPPEQRESTSATRFQLQPTVEASAGQKCMQFTDKDAGIGNLAQMLPLDEVERRANGLEGQERKNIKHPEERCADIDYSTQKKQNCQALDEMDGKLQVQKLCQAESCENSTSSQHSAVSNFEGKQPRGDLQFSKHAVQKRALPKKPAKTQSCSHQIQPLFAKPSKQANASGAQNLQIQASGLRLANGKQEYCAALPDLHMRDLITRIPAAQRQPSVGGDLYFQPPLRGIQLDSMQAPNHAIRLPNGASVFVDCAGAEPVVVMQVYGLKNGVLRPEKTVLKDWIAVYSGGSLVPRPKACLAAKPLQNEVKQKHLASNSAPLLSRSPAFQSQATNAPEQHFKHQKAARKQEKREDAAHADQAALIVQTSQKELDEEQQALWAEVRKAKSSLKYQDALPGLRFTQKRMAVSLSGARRSDGGFIEDQR